MFYNINETNLYYTLRKLPEAVAVMQGSPEYSQISGTVKFYQAMNGVLVVADISGLPTATRDCDNRFFGFHMHNGSACSGNEEDAFANAGMHYNPGDCLHPYHAGDMPPLLGVNGQALLAFLTDRFQINEVLGKTVIIHDGPDDFTSQPSGNAGNKIACGVITSVKR